jgi:ABC-2 type transport system permease protein
MFIIAIPYLSGSRDVIASINQQKLNQAQLQQNIQLYLNSLSYTLPLVMTMLLCSFFSTYAVITDKAKRTLESLLATPVSLRQIWWGKSLAVSLPSIAITFIVLLLAILVTNMLVILPSIGVFLLPSPLALVSWLVIVPIMVYFVVSIVTFLQLIMTNPRIANFAFIAIFLGIYFTTIKEQALFVDLALLYLLVAIVLAAATFLLSRWLKKENVVLSSKG